MGVDLDLHSVSSDEVVSAPVVEIAAVQWIELDFVVKNMLRIRQIVQALFRRCRKVL